MLNSEFAEFMAGLAIGSRQIILEHYGSASLKIERKADQSPVTAADRNAEEFMRGEIRRRFPDHGVIGEEFGEEKPEAEFVWVLDPIDGTKTFACGCPLFGTLIGLMHEGVAALGSIHLPALDQFFVGDNTETHRNGRVTRMRPQPQLERAVLLATDVSAMETLGVQPGFERLRREAGMLRTWGDCYGYTLLVSGGADIMLDPAMNPWDILPLIPVVRGAGGIISTWEGEDPVLGGSCVAANSGLHAEVIRLLNERRQGRKS